MKREFGRLRDGPFDLLVIGGGVYGSWVALDAALRGMKVALVEKDDWASGTSSASSKLIHGGLRYLEYGWIGLVRSALEERRRLCRLAPHRVTPLRFALPIYSGARVSRWRMRLGLWLYDRLAGGEQPVPPHVSLNAGRMIERYGFLAHEGLVGGFNFGDCQTDDARFVVEIVDGATAAGAVAVNHALAAGLLTEGGRVVGAAVEDSETGESIEVRAAVTVAATGSWSDRLLQRSGESSSDLVRASKGVHIVLPALPTSDGLLLVSDVPGRVLFILPWYGRSLVGTTDTDYTADPDRVLAEPEEIDDLLAMANRALENVNWTRDDVVGSFAGLRALPRSSMSSSADVTRRIRLASPLERLLVPVGGKYTSARTDAGRIVRRVERLLDREPAGCPTLERPFPWRPEGEFGAWQAAALARGTRAGLDEETSAGCTLRYGATVDRLFETIESSPDLAGRIVDDQPFCLGEVVHAVEHEMARGLDDVLRRRLPLILLTRPDPRAFRRVAQLVGERLDWSPARVDEELASVIGTRGAGQDNGTR